jgi:hypothetical protein
MTYIGIADSDKKNLKFIRTTTTAHQIITSSWVNIEGSAIDYTPASGATKVIYEFNTMFGQYDNYQAFDIKLKLDNADVTNSTLSIGQAFNGGSLKNGETFLVRHIIDASSWSSSKNLVLQTITYGAASNNQAVINASTDSGGSSSSFLYNPFVLCYSI